MPFGLKKNIIEKINTVFAKYPQIEKVILYGSRAKGSFQNGSDIDLTIIGERIDLLLLHKIEDELDDLLLPYTIDLSIFNRIKNKNLLEHIKRVGVEFYENEKRN
ncbi:nucleotidyltransferase domain protein [bacterium BMS3Abin03]|nr:nucleotidyltransferase domain protein [bacterium BMS3Abin03]